MLFVRFPLSGLPYWLREIPHIIFRANNEPYKVTSHAIAILVVYAHFVSGVLNRQMTVRVSDAERNGEVCEIHSAEVEGCGYVRVSRRTRHPSPGQLNSTLYGVIYLHAVFGIAGDSCAVQISQIENEYGNIKKDHITDGDKYLEWAAQMALSTNTGVPWIMCKQTSAPGEVVTLLLNTW
jgi:hypothetical protein